MDVNTFRLAFIYSQEVAAAKTVTQSRNRHCPMYLKMSRFNELYLWNTLKCVPPKNRNLTSYLASNICFLISVDTGHLIWLKICSSKFRVKMVQTVFFSENGHVTLRLIELKLCISSFCILQQRAKGTLDVLFISKCAI